MRQYISIFISFVCLFILIGCGSDSSENYTAAIPVATPQDTTEALELKTARAWLSAVTNLDGNSILKYTCLEQRDNIQEITAWTAVLPVLGSILVGKDVKVQGDVSDIQFETTAMSDSFAEIYAYGELRMAVSAIADAQQIDEQWYMVYENETWRWCGSLAGNLSLPVPIHVAQAASRMAEQQSQSTVENNNPGTTITTAQELEKYVVGLWIDEAFANSDEVENINIGIAFFPDGRVVDLDAETGTYRAIDSKTIEVTTKDWSDRLVFEIIDSSTAAIYPISSSSDRTIAKRAVANTSAGDIGQDIIGQWEEIGLMFGKRGPIPEFGVQFSFFDDASGAMSGEALAAELGTNSGISFNYAVENKKLVGLYPIGLDAPVDIYSLGDFLFLSFQDEYVGFTKFMQRLGARPATNSEVVPPDKIGQSIIGVWKYRPVTEDEKEALAGHPLFATTVFLSNGSVSFFEGLQPFSVDSQRNLTMGSTMNGDTWKAWMPSEDVLVISIVNGYDSVLLAMDRVQIPHKRLTGDFRQDILGIWAVSFDFEEVEAHEFLPSGVIATTEYVTGLDPSTSAGSYEWIGDTRLKIESQYSVTEYGVSFVDNALILEQDGNQAVLIWSE